MASPDGDCGGAMRYRLAFPYGFVDEGGTHRFWRAGELVGNAEDLALLRSRGADLEEY